MKRDRVSGVRGAIGSGWQDLALAPTVDGSRWYAGLCSVCQLDHIAQRAAQRCAQREQRDSTAWVDDRVDSQVILILAAVSWVMLLVWLVAWCVGALD